MKQPLFIGSILVLIAGMAGLFLTLREKPHDGTALFYQSDFASVPEGTLIRAERDERVYYAAEGQKRWIDSAQTFAAQGFRTEDIRILTSGELARYQDGEPITPLTRLILPSEQKVLPDLVPLAPYELRLATVGGRTVIRFTGSFWNKGYRAFKLISENQMATEGQDGTEDVYQHVQSEDGTLRKKFAGTFVWHPAHHLLPGNWQLGHPVYITYTHAGLFWIFGIIGTIAYHHGRHVGRRERSAPTP